MDNNITRPTIETVLERISTMEGRLTERIDGVNEQLNGLTDRFDGLTGRVDGLSERVDKLTGRFDAWEEDLNIRLDRIESVASRTRSDLLDLRVDFRDLT